MLPQWSYTVWLSGNLPWYATPPHLSVTVPPCLTLFVISLLPFFPSLFFTLFYLLPPFSALSQTVQLYTSASLLSVLTSIRVQRQPQLLINGAFNPLVTVALL